MPSLDFVAASTIERAARVEERCNYRVVGFVLQHHSLPGRAIVLGTDVRWFPNDSDFANMMAWRKHSEGPGTPAEGWPVDETPAPAPIAAPVAAPTAPSRPVLTAPPTAKLLETTEAALGELARDIGCVFRDEIPHNAGWFVPGTAKAHASAYDAIRGRFARLEADGRVYRPPAPPSEPDRCAKCGAAPDGLVAPCSAAGCPIFPKPEPKRKVEPAAAIEQGALF